MPARYGIREEEVDRLLRGGVFVNLYRAVRQGIRPSVENCSIKRLEPLHGFEREVDLRGAGTSIVEVETWLELGQGDERSDLLAQIAGYNRDDCLSALHLRDWLERQRAELADELGGTLPRPVVPAEEETEDSDAQRAANELAETLCVGLPAAAEEMEDEERGRWLLAQLLNWHRREAKASWRRYFYLKDNLTDEEQREEPDALGELSFKESWADPAPRARSTIYRFHFPPQEHHIDIGSSPHDPVTGESVGTDVGLDDDVGVIDVRRGSNRPAPTPTSLIPLDIVSPQPKPESLQRLAQWVLDNSIDAPGRYRAARDLLMRRAHVPRGTFSI